MKTAEFGQPATYLPQPGRCRICGCTEQTSCATPPPDRYCRWADQTRTLCNAPDCIAEAKREIGR